MMISYMSADITNVHRFSSYITPFMEGMPMEISVGMFLLITLTKYISNYSVYEYKALIF